MNREKINKIKLVKIWDIISQETDEEHPIGTNELLDRLTEFGLEMDRRTLYQDIQALNDCGYEIMCRRRIGRGNSNEYYVMERKFSLPEIRILMDAVQAASFITDSKTKDFVERLATLGGSRRAEVLTSNIVAFNTTKTNNEQIYYIVDTINYCIIRQCKVKFVYFDYNTSHERVYRREGRIYYINPIATIMDNGNYYLVGYDDFHPNLLHFRVDRMEQVQDSHHVVKKIAMFENFDIGKHKAELFGMFSGDIMTVTLRADKCLIDAVFDKFGTNTKMIKISEQEFEFTVSVQKSDLFFGWCCSFGRKLRITAPQMIVDEFQNYVKRLLYDEGG